MTFKLVAMPDRIHTFEVQSETGATIGYLRCTETGHVVARSLGNRANAADVRSFTHADLASRWLLAECPAARRMVTA